MGGSKSDFWVTNELRDFCGLVSINALPYFKRLSCLLAAWDMMLANGRVINTHLITYQSCRFSAAPSVTSEHLLIACPFIPMIMILTLQHLKNRVVLSNPPRSLAARRSHRNILKELIPRLIHLRLLQ